MKRQMQLSVPSPCAQSWNSFTRTRQGGFCQSCRKEVIDFTSFTDQQLVDHFISSTKTTCGRFRTDQLKTFHYPAMNTLPSGWKLVKVGLLSLLFAGMIQPLVASTPVMHFNINYEQPSQSLSIENNRPVEGYFLKGTVRSPEDNSPLAGVNIYLKNSPVGTVTDADGKFEFPKKVLPGDVILFSFIGMETQEYTVPKQTADLIEIVINMSMDYEIMLGEVALVYTDARQPSAFRAWWHRVKSKF
jgi:hypothetical protein